jgi:soluble lytic murein transglycosylase
MTRRTIACCLLAALLVSPPVAGPGSATGRYDIPFKWISTSYSALESARFLASYGESRRAHALALQMDPAPPDDPERLEFEIRLLTDMGSYERADSLLEVVAPVGDARAEFRYFLRRAYLNLQAMRYERVLELLARTDSTYGGGYAPYRDFVRLRANLSLGRAEAAVEAGGLALRGEVPAPLSPDFELSLVEALQLAGRPRDALDVVARLERHIGRSSELAPLLELDYRLYLQADDMAGARKTARRLARSYYRTPEAERVSVDFNQRLAHREMDADELLAHAGVMTEHGLYQDARVMLRELDRRQLSSRQREERSIVKARYYYATGEYRRAAALAKPRFSDAAHRRESMLILARSLRQSGHRKDAADVYSYFARKFPNDAKAPEALYVAAGLYGRSGDPRREQELLFELRKSYPSSYFGRMASYRGAAYYFRVRDYGRSVAILKRALSRSRYTDEAAMYYLAMTYGKLGRDNDKQLLLKQLEGLDHHSFYLSPRVESGFRRPPTGSTGSVSLEGPLGLVSFLATVTQRKDAARRTLLAALSPADDELAFGSEAAPCVERGTWFLDVGFRDWGAAELALAGRRCLSSPAQLLALGEVYDRHGLPWHSIRLYQKVKDSLSWEVRRTYARELEYLMYPVPYPVQVLENAAQYDLPPHLVYAMIREESHFDRKAISRVGALGLMQLMPETGRYVARELEMPQMTEEGLLDPEVNITFGIWYASSLFERSGRDYLRMLAAYNAGPANAKRWFGSQRSDADAIEIVDGIDFKETRRYIQRIVESANVYHDLYFDTAEAAAGSGR